MTDAEIIKALECCKSSLQICRADCPLLSETECSRALRENVLDLINRLQADKEALIAGQETLQKNLPKVIKAEAIREFAELLKTTLESGRLYGNDAVKVRIDNLVKEMTEDSADESTNNK